MQQDIAFGDVQFPQQQQQPQYYMQEPQQPSMQVQQPAQKGFDNNWVQSTETGLEVYDPKVQDNGKVVEHTFFGHGDDTSLNMLVSEQKQLEKMQAYSFQQFK
jgi:hypothetical protein